MANQEKLIRRKAWLWPVARHMKMALMFASPAVHLLPPCACRSLPSSLHAAKLLKDSLASTLRNPLLRYSIGATCRRKGFRCLSVSAALPPLDLTEENVKQVLLDARNEFEQVFDTSVGMTGQVELAELDGPFVKLSLRGRFWHKRSTVLERLGTYLKNRIPEILEVDIEDEKQLDDSPENF